MESILCHTCLRNAGTIINRSGIRTETEHQQNSYMSPQKPLATVGTYTRMAKSPIRKDNYYLTHKG